MGTVTFGFCLVQNPGVGCILKIVRKQRGRWAAGDQRPLRGPHLKPVDLAAAHVVVDGAAEDVHGVLPHRRRVEQTTRQHLSGKHQPCLTSNSCSLLRKHVLHKV